MPRVIHRLIHKADFERLLGTPAWSRSAHFSVHHVQAPSLTPLWKHAMPQTEELSTDCAELKHKPVDKSSSPDLAQHLGAVVPKRHAKRAVTRSLLKRQIRAAFAEHAMQLPAGQWLVRLRQPFDPKQFVSARSVALKNAAQQELRQLFSQPNPAPVRGARRLPLAGP